MFFFQGLTMGLAYVAPIGMQNLFVIHSALSHSLRRAVATAFIVLFFDISLSLSCFYGIGTLLNHLPWLKVVILGTGTLLILYMALWYDPPGPGCADPQRPASFPGPDRFQSLHRHLDEPPGHLRRHNAPRRLPHHPACYRSHDVPDGRPHGLRPLVPFPHGLRRRLPPRHYTRHPARHQHPLRHGPHAVRPPLRLYLRTAFLIVTYFFKSRSISGPTLASHAAKSFVPAMTCHDLARYK